MAIVLFLLPQRLLGQLVDGDVLADAVDLDDIAGTVGIRADLGPTIADRAVRPYDPELAGVVRPVAYRRQQGLQRGLAVLRMHPREGTVKRWLEAGGITAEDPEELVRPDEFLRAHEPSPGAQGSDAFQFLDVAGAGL